MHDTTHGADAQVLYHTHSPVYTHLRMTRLETRERCIGQYNAVYILLYKGRFTTKIFHDSRRFIFVNFVGLQ